MDKNGKDNILSPRVKLNHVFLKIRKVKVDQTVSDGVERMLKQTPALYPLRRVECKILTIGSGLPETRLDNIFSGIIPKSFVFGLVNLDAVSGTYDANPYNFAHFGVTDVSLTANGEEIPFKRLSLKYPDDKEGVVVDPAKDNELNFVEAYNTLFSGTGKIYSFDLTPDMCNTTDYFNTVQRGSLSLALKLKTRDKPTGVVCYGDFENVMRIDGERNVIYDIS